MYQTKYRVAYYSVDYSGVELCFEYEEVDTAFAAQVRRDNFNDRGDDEYVARAFRPDGSEMSNAFDVV